MARLSYDLPQVLLLDCAGLVPVERVRRLERQGARVLRTSDPCDALEHLMLRRYDALWIALGDGERAGILLVEELDRDPLLRRFPITVETEDQSPERMAHLKRCGVERVFALGEADEAVAESLLGAAASVG